MVWNRVHRPATLMTAYMHICIKIFQFLTCVLCWMWNHVYQWTCVICKCYDTCTSVLLLCTETESLSRWWFVFISGCTGGSHDDNLRCSQWCKVHQHDELFAAVCKKMEWQLYYNWSRKAVTVTYSSPLYTLKVVDVTAFDVVIFMKFSSFSASEVVILKTSVAAGD